MKNKITRYIAGGLAAMMIGSLTGCTDKFGDYNTNPDQSSKVTPGMLATELILNVSLMYSEPGSSKGALKDDMLSKYIVWTEGNDIDWAFNKLGRFTFSDMEVLNNVEKMINFAPESQANSYRGVGNILRAYKFFNATMRVGDIPYSEAMKGEEDISYPVYDSQETVFAGILDELDEADRLLKDAPAIDGDPVYNGDTEQWRRAGNVLALKILINLYNKTDNATLKVKERMQNIVNSRPIFRSNDDNWQVVHSDRSGQKYPFYKEGNNYRSFPHLSSLVVDSLKQYQDRRLFYYAEPMPNAKQNPSDWASYQGVEATSVHTDIQQRVQAGEVSPINVRYMELADCEPSIKVGYSEMNFILAEAALRGLISGNAEDYYNKGIRAAMEFTAGHTPDDAQFHHGMPIDDAYITSYLAQPKVALSGSMEHKIEQIIVQKYLAEFLETPFNGYFEYRRTGYPRFIINPASNLNEPTDKMPLRWMYSQDEYDYNSENVKAAVQSQFGGNDDHNEKMWILK